MDEHQRAAAAGAAHPRVIVRADVLAAIESAGAAGAQARQVAAAIAAAWLPEHLPAVPDAIAAMTARVTIHITRLLADGMIGYVEERSERIGRAGSGRLRRYWARAHCPPGATIGPPLTVAAVARRAAVARHEPTNPRAVVPTICPSRQDTRYTVTAVESPVFSRLGIGRYLQAPKGRPSK